MNPSAIVVPFDEIRSLEGRVFVGELFTLSPADQELFERATWIDRAYPDPDPPEFPADIIEGFFSLALLDALAIRTLRFDPQTTYGLNYGLDRVRFAAPLRLGEWIKPRFEVTTVRERGPGLLVLRRCTLTTSGSERPGVVADWWVLIMPRGTATAGGPSQTVTWRRE